MHDFIHIGLALEFKQLLNGSSVVCIELSVGLSCWLKTAAVLICGKTRWTGERRRVAVSVNELRFKGGGGRENMDLNEKLRGETEGKRGEIVPSQRYSKVAPKPQQILSL